MGGAGVGGQKSGEAVLCDKMLAGNVDRLAKLPRADERLHGISADIEHRRQLLCAVERHGVTSLSCIINDNRLRTRDRHPSMLQPGLRLRHLDQLRGDGLRDNAVGFRKNHGKDEPEQVYNSLHFGPYTSISRKSRNLFSSHHFFVSSR